MVLCSNKCQWNFEMYEKRQSLVRQLPRHPGMLIWESRAVDSLQQFVEICWSIVCHYDDCHVCLLCSLSAFNVRHWVTAYFAVNVMLTLREYEGIEWGTVWVGTSSEHITAKSADVGRTLWQVWHCIIWSVNLSSSSSSSVKKKFIRLHGRWAKRLMIAWLQ